MYAVIVSGGKQYRVQEGQVIQVEKLDKEPGSSVEFDNILMASKEDSPKVGTPYLKGWSVKAEVVNHGRHDKITIIKMKRRKHYMRKRGHRQAYTQLKITQIVAA